MNTPNTEPQRHREEQDKKLENYQRDPTTSRIIAAAIEVHQNLGPGLLESVYEDCFCYELRLRGIPHARQVNIPVVYKGTTVPNACYRIDVIVDDRIIVELKAVEQALRVHKAQLLSYLRVTGKPKGLLLNFNVPYLAEGITRVVL